MKKIVARKINESNLSPVYTDSDFSLIFTNEKNFYITDKAGLPVKITDFFIVDKETELSNGIKNKFYFTKDTKKLFFFDEKQFISIISDVSGGSGGTNPSFNIENVGNGETLLKTVSGGKVVKSLKEGTNIHITDTGTELILESTLSNEKIININFDDATKYEVIEGVDKVQFQNGLSFKLENKNVSAPKFNNNAYIDFNDMPAWGTTYTIELKLKPNTSTQQAWSGLVFRGNGSSAQGLFIDTNKLYYRNGTSYSSIIETFNETNYPTTEFMHLTLVHNNNTLTVYKINEKGLRKKIGEFNIGVRNSSDIFSIGRFGTYNQSDSYFNGIIDDVRIWNRCLTEEEIYSQYNVKLSGKENGLFAYYKLDEGNGDKVYNNVDINKYIGTCHNITWTNDVPMVGEYKTGEAVIKTTKKSSVDLNLTQRINSVKINEFNYKNSNIKYLFSLDNGVTWLTVINNSTEKCLISEVSTKGCKKEDIENYILDYNIINKNSNERLLYAIYINNNDTFSSPVIESISNSVVLGTNEAGKIASKYVDETHIENGAIPIFNATKNVYEIKKLDVIDKPLPPEIDLSNFVKKTDYDKDKTGFLTKEIYDINNDGSVMYADKIKTIETSSPLTYYGKDINGNIGFHTFPIGTESEDKCCVENRIKLNLKTGEIFTIGIAKEKPNKNILVQAFEFVSGQSDVTKIEKNFDNTDKINFNFNKNNVEFNGVAKIKDSYDVTSKKNDLFETDIINFNDFIEFKSINSK